MAQLQRRLQPAQPHRRRHEQRKSGDAMDRLSEINGLRQNLAGYLGRRAASRRRRGKRRKAAVD